MVSCDDDRNVVKKGEYDELFRNIRRLIEKIEQDPRIGFEGFEMKQELREVVRTLLRIEEKLYRIKD